MLDWQMFRTVTMNPFLQTTSMMKDSGIIILITGDFNDHVGKHGKRRAHNSGFRNEEGTRIPEFCDTNDLLFCNTNIRKPANHLITYESDGHIIWIDYILSRNRDMQMLMNAKSFPGEECITQHRLVASEFRLGVRRTNKQKPTWRRFS